MSVRYPKIFNEFNAFQANRVFQILYKSLHGTFINQSINMDIVKDNLMILALLANISANISIINDKIDIQVIRDNYVSSHVDLEVERLYDYEGAVYCISVPNEVFYVRRDGKAVWTGNSRATGPVVQLTRQPAEGRSRDGGLRFGRFHFAKDRGITHSIGRVIMPSSQTA